MTLPPELESKLQSFFENRTVPCQLRDRVIQIVEMTCDGCNNREIIRSVKGGVTFTGEYLMKLRRDGVV